MKINVTQSNIDGGWRGRPSQCPIALAIRYALNPVCRVAVSSKEVRLTCWDENRGWLIKFCRLPDEASDFVRQFDKHGPSRVAPLEFELEVP